MNSKITNVLDLIGKTPVLPINRLNQNKDVEILAKLESCNPGGSIKDRAALYMIEEAEKSGELTKDKIILEATSGNTGIGLALVAAVKGYRILLTMSEAVSEERVKILRAMGAEVHFTSARLSTDGAIEYVYNLIREEPEKYWLADQFNNEANWKAHYYGTSMEIWEQTGGELDCIVATMGTTGTLMGLSRRFKELKPEVHIVGVEPYMGHKIQGLKNMKESYQPGIFEKERLDRVIHIDDEEAYETARQLARKEGLFVGMSSGAAMAAALRISREMEKGRIVVILPDGGERYLSTSLFATKKSSGLLVYNSLNRKKEEFVPIKENHVTLYSCGPTLCEFIRLDHVRRFLFSDLIRRYMEFKGYQVTHVMNVTDLDDRTIEGAEKAGMPLKDFTDMYYHAFLDDTDSLNILRSTAYPRSSEHVDNMIELTQKLLEKGYAYEKFRSVYFDISRFRDYGRLSRIDLDKIKIGKTVDLDQYEKDNPRDFTLLKRSTLSELKSGIFFKTKWGNVRPGWHLECAVMAIKHFGGRYDIHTGGINLVFPHHENSIAISQALTDNLPANYWLHNETVTTNGERTPDISVTDPVSFRDLIKEGYTGRQIRYWLLSRHYRKPIFFSRTKLGAVKNTINHLDNFVQKIHHCRTATDNHDTDQAIYDLKRKFIESMDDDFNTAGALAALFQFTHRLNRIMDKDGLSPSGKKLVLQALENINSVLAVMDLGSSESDKEIETLIAKRELARQGKDWPMADDLRNKLKEMSVEVIDTKDGPVWRKV
ncbi:Cysteine--tRNA ligase [uncultured Desulfobacterium sp.]|uniref:Cysteine--tRNA ligase n=1 Tax=uncultured Desulfobacterium sp. TaxID=201089 RepID=A0A445MSG2_9BACT|nr:Cysteine--tRNA ligase [uncultured Desulfobacterium sp.]